MVKLHRILLMIPFMAVFVNCSNVRKVDTTSVKEHLGDYKIKKISQEQIVAQVEKFGGENKAGIEKQLDNEAVVKKAGCDFKLFPVSDSLNALSPGIVRMIRSEDLKKAGAFQPKEKEVLEAYQYSFEKNLESGTNIQQLNDTLYLFTIPVSKKSAYSKTCVANDPHAYAVVELLLNKSYMIRQIK